MGGRQCKGGRVVEGRAKRQGRRQWWRAIRQAWQAVQVTCGAHAAGAGATCGGGRHGEGGRWW